jgi:uncharacterized membrane protein YkvA (DUF1232 family)
MIKELINQALSRINAITDDEVVKTIAAYNMVVNPKLFEDYSAEICREIDSAENAASFSPEKIAEFYAHSQKNAIRTIPDIVMRIEHVIDEKDCCVEEKLALYSVLFYLIKEDDIINDNTKDGIGYLDDAFVIYTLFQSQQFIDLMHPSPETQKLINYYWNILRHCFYEVIHDKLNKQVGIIWKNFHKLLYLPIREKNYLISQIENNPILIDEILKQDEYINIKVPDTSFLRVPVDPAVYQVFLQDNQHKFDPFSDSVVSANGITSLSVSSEKSTMSWV